MIIPKRDAKSYGAVHIDHYLTFTGFCKKVYSDEIQSIDVLIDGQKIDTITCDKTIEKVYKIYDIDGYGFEYDLPEIYFDRRHILSFRCSDSGEELVNSPISTIARDDEKFNEYKFNNNFINLNFLNKSMNQHIPQRVIHTLILDINQNSKMINFLTQYCDYDNNTEIRIFSFNDITLHKVQEITQGYNQIKCYGFNNIDLFFKDFKIFIYDKATCNKMKYDELFYFIAKKYTKVYTVYFGVDIFNVSYNNKYISEYNNFGFTTNELVAANKNIPMLIHNHICNTIPCFATVMLKTIEETEEFYYFIMLKYALDDIRYLEELTKLTRISYENRAVRLFK